MTTGTPPSKNPLRILPSRRNKVDSESAEFSHTNGENDGVSNGPAVEPAASPQPTTSKVPSMGKVMSVAKHVCSIFSLVDLLHVCNATKHDVSLTLQRKITVDSLRSSVGHKKGCKIHW